MFSFNSKFYANDKKKNENKRKQYFNMMHRNMVQKYEIGQFTSQLKGGEFFQILTYGVCFSRENVGVIILEIQFRIN